MEAIAMEATDRELIQKYMLTDVTLERLYREHNKLEDMISRYSTRSFLTDEEQAEVRKLKKRKLSGVDRMMSIVERYRTTASMI